MLNSRKFVTKYFLDVLDGLFQNILPRLLWAQQTEEDAQDPKGDQWGRVKEIRRTDKRNQAEEVAKDVRAAIIKLGIGDMLKIRFRGKFSLNLQKLRTDK